MGCDIHPFIEYKNSDSWSFFASVHIDRDYGLFHCLAAVRGYDAEVKPISEPKGMPKDISSAVIDEYCYFISESNDDSHISKEKAEEYIKSGSSERFDEYHITRPDWHSASWLTLSEVKEAYKRYLNYYKAYIEKPIDVKTSDEFHKFIEETKNIHKPIERNKDIEAVIACMESLSLNCDDVRLVFWFDN